MSEHDWSETGEDLKTRNLRGCPKCRRLYMGSDKREICRSCYRPPETITKENARKQVLALYPDAALYKGISGFFVQAGSLYLDDGESGYHTHSQAWIGAHRHAMMLYAENKGPKSAPIDVGDHSG